MELHPDYNKDYDEEKSPEYKKIRAELDKLRSERSSYEWSSVGYFFLGFVVIICTMLFVKNKKG